jgi:hypothetical protein
MSITTPTGGTFEATVDNAPTGLVGTLTVRIEDGQNNIITAATTSGIVESGTGVYTATLTTPDYGQYVVIWNDGTGTEAAEDLFVNSYALADSYFTVDDLRARYPEITAPKYSDADVQDAIDLATEAFEHAADVAFTPRTEVLTLTADDGYRLNIPRARVTAVTAVSGSSSGTVTLDGQIIAGGLFINSSPWLTTETLTVTVTHGYTVTPKPVIRAVQLLARTWLIRGPVDDRATQIPSAEGGVINLATPGLFGSTFGIPFVDATLEQYRHHALVP